MSRPSPPTKGCVRQQRSPNSQVAGVPLSQREHSVVLYLFALKARSSERDPLCFAFAGAPLRQDAAVE